MAQAGRRGELTLVLIQGWLPACRRGRRGEPCASLRVWGQMGNIRNLVVLDALYSCCTGYLKLTSPCFLVIIYGPVDIPRRQA